MSLPLIGTDNILGDATVACTTEDTGYEVEFLNDSLPFTWFRPNGAGTHYVTIDALTLVTVDYIGIFSHDLGEKLATVKLQWSADGSTGWTDLTTALTSLESAVIFVQFADVTQRYFRLEVICNVDTPHIGMVSIGKTLEMQRGMPAGFVPPHMAINNKYINNKADSGLLLGRTIISKSNKTTVSNKLVTPEWVRTYWIPFLEHAQEKPFFFSWNYGSYPDESVVCISTSKIKHPKYKDAMFMDISIEIEAWSKL